MEFCDILSENIVDVIGENNMNIKEELCKNLCELIGIVAAATLLGKIFVELGFPETNIVVMYLLAVLLVARFTSGYHYGILSAVVSLFPSC